MMTAKIWRISHFALALTGAVFILLASVSGFILAFEPIQAKWQNRDLTRTDDQTLGGFLQVLTENQDEIFEVQVDENGVVSASVLEGDFLIDPQTGKIAGEIPSKNVFFEFITNFHRSLFLKTTGRIIIGITSFLLCLIALTGCLLLIKRQKGIRQFFQKIINENFTQFSHVYLGRLSLIPILIISISGAWLSLDRFSAFPDPFIPVKRIQSHSIEKIDLSEFEIFRKTKLHEVKKLEFPFSTDEEDYFILETESGKFEINQYTGTIENELRRSTTSLLSNLGFEWHTGVGSITWSLILAISSLNILYFIYSGFVISISRIGNKIRNSFQPNEVEYVILYGSENGSTRFFANHLKNELIREKKKVFVDELNSYQAYPNMKTLVIMTSTYGSGDPPSNANRFLNLFKSIKTQSSGEYEGFIVGFGSFAYPKFCQFALDIHHEFQKNKNIFLPHSPFLIHNQSIGQYNEWLKSWSKIKGLGLNSLHYKTQKHKKYTFRVMDKKSVKNDLDDVFVLKLKGFAQRKVKSGDLLSFTPPNEETERLYSVCKSRNGNILLSVKRHENGIGSNFLNSLNVGESISCGIIENSHFHFPQSANTVILIANGTGIAPFLGMIQNRRFKGDIYLYWGSRTRETLDLYQSNIDRALRNKTLTSFKTAFSQAELPRKYVQDLLREDEGFIIRVLESGAKIMICGSLSMQDDVLSLIEEWTQKHFNQSLDHYKNKGQILMDCY